MSGLDAGISVPCPTPSPARWADHGGGRVRPQPPCNRPVSGCIACGIGALTLVSRDCWSWEAAVRRLDIERSEGSRVGGCSSPCWGLADWQGTPFERVFIEQSTRCILIVLEGVSVSDAVSAIQHVYCGQLMVLNSSNGSFLSSSRDC